MIDHYEIELSLWQCDDDGSKALLRTKTVVRHNVKALAQRFFADLLAAVVKMGVAISQKKRAQQSETPKEQT